MKRKKYLYILFVLLCIFLLNGCEKNLQEDVNESNTSDIQSSTSPDSQNEESEDSEDKKADCYQVILPNLPEMVYAFEDYAKDGWTVLDSIALDYNQDGYEDTIGVIEYDFENGEYSESNIDSNVFYPRVLIIAQGTKDHQHHLDLYDDTLIRTKDEGGVFGDPYLPLTVEGNSFSVHSYGGSSWKWEEEDTYTYKDDTWFLEKSCLTNYFMGYIVSESCDDYSSGIGYRGNNDDNNERIEANNYENHGFELEYKLRLREAPTLTQYAQRNWRADDRMEQCPVIEVRTSKGVSISEQEIQSIENSIQKGHLSSTYRDENYICYFFYVDEAQYLTCYDKCSKTLWIVAKDQDHNIDYSMSIDQDILYFIRNKKTDTEDKITLCKTSIDGEQQEELYTYNADSSDSYSYILFEIAQDEIILQISKGDGTDEYIRIDMSGKNIEQIGTLPARVE